MKGEGEVERERWRERGGESGGETHGGGETFKENLLVLFISFLFMSFPCYSVLIHVILSIQLRAVYIYLDVVRPQQNK